MHRPEELHKHIKEYLRKKREYSVGSQIGIWEDAMDEISWIKYYDIDSHETTDKLLQKNLKYNSGLLLAALESQAEKDLIPGKPPVIDWRFFRPNPKKDEFMHFGTSSKVEKCGGLFLPQQILIGTIVEDSRETLEKMGLKLFVYPYDYGSIHAKVGKLKDRIRYTLNDLYYIAIPSPDRLNSLWRVDLDRDLPGEHYNIIDDTGQKVFTMVKNDHSGDTHTALLYPVTN